MDFSSIDRIKQEGFSGFLKVDELRSDFKVIPNVPGVYLIICPDDDCQFLNVGSGGFFKGKDPNVSVELLEKKWVIGSKVLYIGKAGGEGNEATLRSRITQYLKFGQGKAVGHYGGRFIWQLTLAGQLLVAWKLLEKLNPRDEEMRLLKEFYVQFKTKPFANIAN